MKKNEFKTLIYTINIKLNMECNYRNCVKEIDYTIRRIDAKYCCDKCKENERTYLKRERRNKRKIVEDLKQIEKHKDILELYQKIYKK
jgi:hypothetical protein